MYVLIGLLLVFFAIGIIKGIIKGIFKGIFYISVIAYILSILL